jgi:hypothetical protein
MGIMPALRPLIFAAVCALTVAACAGSSTTIDQLTGPPSIATNTGQRLVSNDTFVDKITAGYQAWFSCPSDPSSGWTHWSPQTPAPGHVTFELYPDVRDYDSRDVCQTGLGNLGNGQPSKLYNAASDRVIDLHFSWMEQYGIEGVGLQRFVVGLSNIGRMNAIAASVRDAAVRHGRIFYVMYDISGAHESDWVDVIKNDWQSQIEGALGLPGSAQYAHQDGKAVVNIWGLGVGDRPGTPQQALDLINWFKGRGVYVVGGVPYWWRTPGGGKDGFDPVYAALDMVQPWAVGTFANVGDIVPHFEGIVDPDVALTTSRGQAYQRVLWSGFAWSNWNGGARNAVPRLAGKFFWPQAEQTAKRHLGAYIAMFDEYDEGTAIAKAAEDSSMIPNNQYFLSLDADGTRVSSDFYLRLAGAATRMLHGQDPISDTVPVPPFDGNAPPPPPSTPSPPPPSGNIPPPTSAQLVPNQALHANDRLVSADGQSFFTYQGDGNLVLYTPGGPVWASSTVGSPGTAIMQSDGNLVIYDGSGAPVWASHTEGNPGAFLSLLNDGRFAIYRADGTPLWSSAQ